MTTLKKVAIVCLVAAIALAMVASLFGQAANAAVAGFTDDNSRIRFNDIPTATPTFAGGTDSNPSGGGSGGG